MYNWWFMTYFDKVQAQIPDSKILRLRPVLHLTGKIKHRWYFWDGHESMTSYQIGGQAARPSSPAARAALQTATFISTLQQRVTVQLPRIAGKSNESVLRTAFRNIAALGKIENRHWILTKVLKNHPSTFVLCYFGQLGIPWRHCSALYLPISSVSCALCHNYQHTIAFGSTIACFLAKCVYIWTYIYIYIYMYISIYLIIM